MNGVSKNKKMQMEILDVPKITNSARSHQDAKRKEIVAPKEVKRTEVIEDSKFKGVVESSKVASVVETVGVDDISAPRSTVAPIVDTTVDRLVRRDGEDIVMYARRLVRVSEVEVLRYFSPRELEIALERGNLLRKRGVIIFAHA